MSEMTPTGRWSILSKCKINKKIQKILKIYKKQINIFILENKSKIILKL
jgi:hypothetical protein